MKNLAFLILIVLSANTFAQDKIVKKTGDIINCEVTEIGLDEVKYNYPDKPKITFSMDKGLITKIEFASGEIMKIESNSIINPDYYADQSKRALKLNFLSPLTGTTEIVYEQNIKPGKSWETSLGIIGLGLDPQDVNPTGVYGKFAYKFTRIPDFYMNRMRYAHILKGGYIAPEISLRYMKYDANNYDYYSYQSTTSREEDLAFALMLKFGKQWVFDDSFLVDLYAGIGYGFSGSEDEVLNYGFIAGTGDIPIAFTSGLRIGWVF